MAAADARQAIREIKDYTDDLIEMLEADTADPDDEPPADEHEGGGGGRADRSAIRVPAAPHPRGCACSPAQMPGGGLYGPSCI